MIIAYINLNISLDQINDIFPDGEFDGKPIEKKYIQQKMKKRENGQLIIPTYDEDAEEQLIQDAKPGDTVLTSTLINFSRSHAEMLRTLRLLNEKNVRVISLVEKFDSEADDGKALLEAIGILQRYNRSRSKERITRQREGMERAKTEGTYNKPGRKSVSIEDFEDFETFYDQFENYDLSKLEFARRLGISRPTLDKLINLRKGGQG